MPWIARALPFDFPYEATKVGVEFGLQIGDNQLGATLGAETMCGKKR